MKLTDEQRAIVEADFEHAVITAVAGSGKTTTLAHRICSLLDRGHDPRRILILMFNRAAQQDFAARLHKVSGGRHDRLPEVRTYHAMGLRLYQRLMREGALPVYEGEPLSDKALHLQLMYALQAHLPEHLQTEFRRNRKEFIELAALFHDLVKSTLQPPAEVLASMDVPDDRTFLLRVLQHFEQWRLSNRRITFADMLYQPVKAIHEQPDLLALVTNKMDMILVDEYQDTNDIQHRLLKAIAGHRARVTVVGDPDQTIYEFRGAEPAFILNRFGEEFESPRQFTLSYSFRYGHRSALLANHLITHNRGRRDVLCRAHPGNPDTRIHVLRPRDEAGALVQQCKALLADGCNPEEIAILVRTWSQTVPIELALLAARVPYRIPAGKGALNNRDVANLLYLVEMLAGVWPTLPEAARLERWRSLLAFMRPGLKNEHCEQLAHQLAPLNEGWGDALLDAVDERLHPLQRKKLRETATALTLLAHSREPVWVALRRFMHDCDLFNRLTDSALTYDAADEQIENLLGLLRYLRTLELDAPGILAHFAQLREQAGHPSRTGIQLCTIHRTKGLEWPVVMLPGFTDRFYPYSPRQSEPDASALESERRLAYVGITRARDALYLYTVPENGSSEARPSPFLAEMEAALSDWIGQHLHHTPENTALEPTRRLTPVARRYLMQLGRTFTEPPPPAGESTEAGWLGARVRHPLLGKGVVTAELDDARTVQFETGEAMNFSLRSWHLFFVRVTEDSAGTLH
ncbi:ATP-dependent helicase [Hahella sp. SMD15-11]|uniref:DNA 3'-5' helicase n=1 Tax=Thermohahella caldifontis TaxID=3142973 RepID=A0AB39UT37_9GAMM